MTDATTLSDERRQLIERRLRRTDGATSAIPRQRQTGGPAPLSFAQERLWFLDQLAPGSAFYSVPSVLPLAPGSDPEVMVRALEFLVARHASLRTRFPSHDGRPVQVVEGSSPLVVERHDLRGLPSDGSARLAETLATAEARRPFDLATGPLVRAAIISLGDDQHRLLLTLHHIVADGWSVSILLRELAVAYAALADGAEPPLPALPVAYVDFSVWQRERLQGAAVGAELGYWRRRLDRLAPLALPTDRPRSTAGQFRGAVELLAIDGDITRALAALAAGERATLFMTLLAGFAALLARYTGEDDIAIGAPTASRTRPELEGVVGFFVNALVLRCDLTGRPTFRTLLRRVRECALEAYGHQELPFELLVEALRPDRDPARNPLFSVTLQLLSGLGGSQGLVSDAGNDRRGTAIFDIAATFAEAGDGLAGSLEYSTELFAPETIMGMARHFETLLGSVASAPDRPLHEHDLLGDGERRRLAEFNATDRPYRFEPAHEQVGGAADAVAVSQGPAALTYAELDARAGALATVLRERGATRGALIGVCAQRSLELVVALLAVLRTGAAYVPLDPELPAPRLAALLADSRPALLVGGPGLPDALEDHPDLIDLRASPPPAGEPLNPPVVSPDDIAYVIYTSGSTGNPKGVEIPHRALANHLRWMQEALPLTSEDRVLQRTPIGFDASVWEFWAPLAAGARLVLAPPESAVKAALADVLRREAITVVQLVPTLARMLLSDRGVDGCSSVRSVFCGGEPLPAALARELADDLGADVFNLYGPTETCIDATWSRFDPDAAGEWVPIGRPIANTRAYVLDERLAPAPIGVPGELCVAGDGLARGYHNAPELTAQRFIEDPHGPPGTRLYRTGDRARWRGDGTLEFLGRLDDQLKIRGHRIEPAEITTVLQTHPDVADAAVIAHEHAPGDRRLTAYIVPRPTALEGAAQAGVEAWQHLYDETYGGPSDADPTFDLTGWTSALDGRPIPAEEMREWLETTVARILAAGPRRVLEIGCGTGLLLHAIAPRVDEYVGTDLSPVVIERLGKAVARRGLSGVRLAACPADELPDLGGPFDMLVINSVVQYFPSIEYLLSVLERALEQLAPRATVFVGDVRSLPLLRALHLEIERAQNPGKAPVAAGVAARVARERELVLDPAFFLALTHGLSRIVHAETAPKLGRAPNELNRFRYDAVLRLDAVPEPASPPWSDWPAGEAPAVIVARLCDAHPGGFAVRGIPDVRVADALDALAAIDGADPRGGNAQDPWTLCELGAQRGYRVTTRLSPAAPGSFDAIFVPTGRQTQDVVARMPGAALRPWASYANAPLQARAAENLVPELRRRGGATPPDGIVPAHIVALERLPRTANGKLDRQALPGPGTVSQHRQSPPRTPTEKAIASLWTELLGIDGIDVNDNFFTELGGHSLLATQVTARLRAEHRIELPLRRLFEHPTIAALAADVDGAIAAGEDATAAPIPRQPRAAMEEAR